MCWLDLIHTIRFWWNLNCTKNPFCAVKKKSPAVRYHVQLVKAWILHSLLCRTSCTETLVSSHIMLVHTNILQMKLPARPCSNADDVMRFITPLSLTDSPLLEDTCVHIPDADLRVASSSCKRTAWLHCNSPRFKRKEAPLLTALLRKQWRHLFAKRRMERLSSFRPYPLCIHRFAWMENLSTIRSTLKVLNVSFEKRLCMATQRLRMWSHRWVAMTSKRIVQQTGRLMIASVHLERDSSLRNLRERFHDDSGHWSGYPAGLGTPTGNFNIFGPEEGSFNVTTQTFSDGDLGRSATFRLFVHTPVK